MLTLGPAQLHSLTAGVVSSESYRDKGTYMYICIHMYTRSNPFALTANVSSSAYEPWCKLLAIPIDYSRSYSYAQQTMIRQTNCPGP